MKIKSEQYRWYCFQELIHHYMGATKFHHKTEGFPNMVPFNSLMGKCTGPIYYYDFPFYMVLA